MQILILATIKWEEIRRGLESGIDVSQYVFPYLASPVMRQKRERLEYEQTLNM